MAVVSQLSASRLLVRQCAWLTGAAAALWALLAIPAWLTAGVDGLEGLSYAAVLCLVPGWAVFLLASSVSDRGVRTLVTVAGGMSLRFVFVLVGVLTIPMVRPRLGLREFVLWLVVFYLATLAVETVHLIRGNSTGNHLGQAGC